MLDFIGSAIIYSRSWTPDLKIMQSLTSSLLSVGEISIIENSILDSLFHVIHES